MIAMSVAAYGVLSSTAGIAVTKPRELPRVWAIVAGCVSAALLFVASSVAPLGVLAAVPVLLFASASDLRTKTTPRATLITLALISFTAMLLDRGPYASLTFAWALAGGNLALVSILGRPRDRIVAAALLLASIFALGHPTWPALFAIAFADVLLIRVGISHLSERGLGFGDLMPAAILSAALGPELGLRLFWLTALAVCAWTLLYTVMAHMRARHDNFAPVAPALLTAYLFLTFTARLT